VKTVNVAIAVGFFLAVSASSVVAQGTLYKWTDAQGRVHYTNTPTRSDAQTVDDALPPASSFVGSPEPAPATTEPSQSAPEAPKTPETAAAPPAAQGETPTPASPPPGETPPAAPPAQQTGEQAGTAPPPAPVIVEPQDPSSVFQKPEDFPSFEYENRPLLQESPEGE
jgi:hypothetical protein